MYHAGLSLKARLWDGVDSIPGRSTAPLMFTVNAVVQVARVQHELSYPIPSRRFQSPIFAVVVAVRKSKCFNGTRSAGWRRSVRLPPSGRVPLTGGCPA